MKKHKLLSDFQKKQVIAERVAGKRIAEIAKEFGVADNTIRNILRNSEDFEQLCAEKKAEEAKNILDCMEEQSEKVSSIIRLGLDLLPEKLQNANPTQISTVIGTLIDKWTLLRPKNEEKGSATDPLSESLKNLAKEMDAETKKKDEP
mgnify:CR=1 FL=1